jgi:glycosyltransferase involved in cell wall biosynthesis
MVPHSFKPRVAVVLPSLRGSGCEHQVARMLFALVREFDITLVLYVPDIAYPIPADLRVVCIGTDPSTEHTLSYKAFRFGVRIARLARLFARERFDAILSFIDLNNVIVTLAHSASRTSSKLIVVERTINDDFFRSNPGARRIAPVAKRLLTWAYSHAGRVVAISESMRRYLQDGLGIDRPIDVILNGVDTDVYHPASASDALPELDPRFGKASCRLLHVGGLNQRKNQAFLLDVLPLVRRVHPDVHLFFIGIGPLEQTIHERVARLGLDTCVHMLGWRTDVADYMRHADALLLSSLSEGTPNVVYEALACGLPVVTTASTGALYEMIRDPSHGSVVPLGDIPAFVDAILETLRDRSPHVESRREWGRAVGAHFAWSRCENSYVSLVRQSLNGAVDATGLGER